MAIYVELKGTFSIEINEDGLDINNPEDVEYAKEDLLFELAQVLQLDLGYVSLSYDEDDIKVSEGDSIDFLAKCLDALNLGIQNVDRRKLTGTK